jgi:hypothetical protein
MLSYCALDRCFAGVRRAFHLFAEWFRRKAMNISRRSRVRLCVAIAAGLSASFLEVRLAHAQQSLTDPTVMLNANDSTGLSSFFGGPTYQWAASSDGLLTAGTAPTAGYAYVVTGSAAGTGQLTTPTTGSATFAGNSLTIIPFNGQANLYNSSTDIVNAQDNTAGLYLFGATSGLSVTVPNLVLANGGVVINSASNSTVLNGTIDLLPAGTSLDGIVTNTSGGIIDSQSGPTSNPPVLTIASKLTGSGTLHLLSTNTNGASVIALN